MTRKPDPQPKGMTFSSLYLPRGEPQSDSPRFRRRLSALLELFIDRDDADRVLMMLQRQSGLAIPKGISRPYFVDDMQRVMEGVEMRDLLDAITHLYRYLCNTDKANRRRDEERIAPKWVAQVEAIMRETNVAFTIDEEGGVHYAVDEEFAGVKATTLAGLGAKHLQTARAAYEDAHRHLDSGEKKAALRSMFEALEILSKQMCPGATRLDSNLATGRLKQKCLELLGTTDEVERTALGQMFSALAKWTDGMHSYRHGQSTKEPSTPSDAFTILAVSSGSTFLRLLADAATKL